MSRRFESSLSLSGLLSGESRKATVVLLAAPVVLATFHLVGSRQFYARHLQHSVVLFGDPERTAAGYAFLFSFLVLGGSALIAIRWVFREPLGAYGVRLGDWRFGLRAVAVLAPVLVLAAYLSSRNEEFLAEYPLWRGAGTSGARFLAHAATYLAYYAGWELFFRGFVQHGLRDALGDWNAVLVQTLASTLVHIGKPTGELYGAIAGGIVWGLVTFRARSIWPALLLHWLLGISLDYFILRP